MPVDSALESFLKLQPWDYKTLTGCDLHQYYVGARDAYAPRMDLWLRREERSAMIDDPLQLHLTCYEVDYGSGAYEIWMIPARGHLELSFEALQDRQPGRLRYTLKDRELRTLCQCYRFEVRLEEKAFEYRFS